MCTLWLGPAGRSTHERAIEALARAAHVLTAHVAQLYAHALIGLTGGARISGFLTILTPQQELGWASCSRKKPKTYDSQYGATPGGHVMISS